MKPEAQRLAIAKACGWEETRNDGLLWHPQKKVGRIVPGTEVYAARVRMGLSLDDALIPDYLSDLNACHEMERALNWNEQESTQLFIYRSYLTKICGNDRDLVPFATAAQRSEAFLRTLRLWRDDA